MVFCMHADRGTPGSFPEGMPLAHPNVPPELHVKVSLPTALPVPSQIYMTFGGYTIINE